MSTVAVIGSGYVGVTTAAIAANAGYTVHLIDINPQRIKVLQSGKSFFYEEGIDPLIKKAVDEGSLILSTKYDGVAEADIVFSCVGTPDNPDGSSNLEYVFAAAKTAKPLLKKQAIYVQKSTVPVGTGRNVMQELSKETIYVSNPEFLREGTAVHDTLFFDRIVAGSDDEAAATSILSFYREVEKHRDRIAALAGITSNVQTEGYIATNLESAELIKVTANAFLALKISFANSIAKLADAAGANILNVMDAVGADRRIGRAFLNAGRGYGGGCFPKDVSGLISSATDYGVDMPIMTATIDVNESMPGYVASKAQQTLGGSLKDKKIAVLGLAFKAGTSDARKSPGIKIANLLQKSQAVVSAYDPHANKEAKEYLSSSVSLHESIKAAMKDADAIIIATDWPEFKTLTFTEVGQLMRGKTIVDAMNCLDRDRVEKADLVYIGIGR